MNGRIMLALVAVLTAITVCVILHLTSEIFVPLVVAWFLVQISHPVIDFGRRKKLPHAVIVLMVFLGLFAVCAVCAYFVAAQIREAERLFALYSDKLGNMINDAMTALEIPAESVSVMTFLRRYLGNISGEVFHFLSLFSLTLIFLMFMLTETPGFRRKIDIAFPGENGERIKMIMSSISLQISRYLVIMVLVSLVTGIAVWASLSIIGVELAGGWGVVAFILNFIPTVGPVIATIPPVVMSALQYSPLSGQTIATLAVLGTIQMVTGNVILPKMMGKELGLSPVVVMLSLLLWAMILGIPGAILSVPIASIIKIVCENVPGLKPIAVVMGNDEEE